VFKLRSPHHPSVATYVVTRVRKQWSVDGSHRHIVGVCTDDGVHWRRIDVARSIDAGDVWRTSADGHDAIIRTTAYCPHPGCVATPYLQTRPDTNGKDSLENLDEC